MRAKIGKLSRDISFAEFLRRRRREIPPRLRELACNFVEGYHASHARHGGWSHRERPARRA
ncbi:MAG TPA: hypothetical protein VGQ36_07625 [Thermoanaerobaculia bacterium]|nr:hypothetical protein [Thermoanaerobaculia bacterium]